MPAAANGIPAARSRSTSAVAATTTHPITAPAISAPPNAGLQQEPEYRTEMILRVYAGRNLRLEHIMFYGFDLDYTLAHYKTPHYEQMLFQRIIERLVHMGYPDELRKLRYDSTRCIRGLWFDPTYGNLLKVDGFGNIMNAWHGLRYIEKQDVERTYPNRYLKLTDKVLVLNTLFDIPKTYLLAALVDYFDRADGGYTRLDEGTGVRSGERYIHYETIAQDVVAANDWVHTEGSMKRHVADNIDKYLEKDERASLLLTRLRQYGRKTFLLTNSEFWYTNKVMTHLLGSKWADFFDFSIVDAHKPKWFADRRPFHELDPLTGKLKIGRRDGAPLPGQVYSGGSCNAFKQMTQARGREVLYIGDHIFGDVLRSKKSCGWKTFLVIPELAHELDVWHHNRELFTKLQKCTDNLQKLYKTLDPSLTDPAKEPAITHNVAQLRETIKRVHMAYGPMGSHFRSGYRSTFFATQVERFADLYSSSPYNLVAYRPYYNFRVPMPLMPHERVVDHLRETRPSAWPMPTPTPSPGPVPDASSSDYDDIDDEPVQPAARSDPDNSTHDLKDVAMKSLPHGRN
ncbi:5' nucleotidase family [Aphelenchoides avenae]|nr:5' nucleotidase family [Aphelenchus avenae]